MIPGVWTAVRDVHPASVDGDETMLLGNMWGVMGEYTNYYNDKGVDRWFIDDAYYDGDEPPTHWLIVPHVPT